MDENEVRKLILEPDFMSNMEFQFTDDFFLKFLINQFLSTDDAEGLSTAYLNNYTFKKTNEGARRYFRQGRAALEAKDNNVATVAFTKGLMLVPKASPKIADFYIERSKALQKLKAYEESFQDIERALNLPIPELQRDELTKRQQILRNIMSDPNLQENVENISREEITLSYGENNEMKGVSEAITYTYNENFGRHFVAQRDIKVGDILMIQKPFVSVPKRSEEKSKGNEWACDYCLSLILNPIPCENCTFCVYCSFDCRTNAYKKYHRIECEIFQHEYPTGSKTALFLRTLLVVTKHGEKFHEIVTAMEEIKQAADRRNIGFKDGKFDGCSRDAVLNLLIHSNERKVPAIEINAACVSTSLKKKSGFLKGDNLIDVFKLGQLITYLSYICLSNLFNIRRNNYQNTIGYGLYPAFNLLNHSCACNSFTYEDKNRNKILRACKNIKKGEQITISYIGFPETFMTVEDRKEFLNKNFCFNCECEFCQTNHKYNVFLRKTYKLPRSLQLNLTIKPNDTQNLWEILKLVENNCREPCREAKAIEYALTNAYFGSENEDVWSIFRNFGMVD